MNYKKRHWFVTAWLIIMITLNALSAIGFLFSSTEDSREILGEISSSKINLFGILNLLNVVFLIMILKWNRLGLYGLVISKIVFVIAYISVVGFILSLSSLIGLGILFYIMQLKKDGISAWENLFSEINVQLEKDGKSEWENSYSDSNNKNEIPSNSNELLVKEEISSKIERKMKRRARKFVFQMPNIKNLKTGKETFLEGKYQIDISIPYIIIIRIDTEPVKIVLFRYIHEKPNDLAFMWPSMRDTKYFTDSDNNKYTIYPSAFGGIRVLCKNERFELSGTLYSAK